MNFKKTYYDENESTSNMYTYLIKLCIYKTLIYPVGI